MVYGIEMLDLYASRLNGQINGSIHRGGVSEVLNTSKTDERRHPILPLGKYKEL